MSVIFSAWTVANIPNLNARAFTTGVLLACLNSDGLIVSNIFFVREAPRYQTALIVIIVFACTTIVFTLAYSLYLRLLNRKLDRGVASLAAAEDVNGIYQFRFQA
jgi:uncharacterized membrane protein